MTFVLNYYTKQANALANAETLHFQHLVMFGTAFFLQECRNFHQRVPFESCRLILGLHEARHLNHNLTAFSFFKVQKSHPLD